MTPQNARRTAILHELERIQAAALVCSEPADLLSLTGYWPVMGGSIAVLTREDNLSVIVPEDELELAQTQTGNRIDTHWIPYKPVTLDRLHAPGEVLFHTLGELLRQLRPAPGALAMRLENHWQPIAYLAGIHLEPALSGRLRERFPERALVSADTMLARAQSIKTEHELEQLRRACALAAAGFAQAAQAIAAGRREDEVAADLSAAFARIAQRDFQHPHQVSDPGLHNQDQGFERAFGFFFCMSGPNSAKAAGAYARTRSRVLEPGDLVMIHANTVGDGLWTDLTRTYTVGEPSQQQKHMFAAIAEARAAALAAIAPGAAACEVDQAARSTLGRHGYASNFKHATGHGVGFAAASPHALPRIHPQSPDILAAGMTFNIEPAIYFDQPSDHASDQDTHHGSDRAQGMRHCDVVACTSDGFEVLTPFIHPLHDVRSFLPINKHPAAPRARPT